MTSEDRPRFAELLFALAETFDETMSEMRAEIYFRAVCGHAIEHIEVAMIEAARSMKFFPKPAELLAFIEGDPTDDAELAWSTVYRQVRAIGYLGTPQFSDDAILRAIGDVFGGWQALCSKLPNDGPELLGWAKQFKATYLVYRKREPRRPRLIVATERFKGLLP